MKPKVSIITPTYNHSEVIAECLYSTIGQTFEDWEQIVVDDGSSDGTPEIVEELSKADPRIRLIRESHKGIMRLAETYNLALSKAQGELIAILEGDDFWPSTKLETQVKIHEDEKIILSHGHVSLINNGKVVGYYPAPPTLGEESTEAYFRFALLKQSCIMPVSVILRRDAVERLGGFHQDNGFPAVDYSTWIRLFQLPGKVFYYPDCLGFWRQTPQQTTQKVFDESTAELGLRIALAQFDKLDPEARTALKVSRNRIISENYSRSIVDVYLGVLRRALRVHDRETARKCGKVLIRRGKMKRKVEGFAGLVAAELGFDLESVFNLFDKTTELNG